jgi:hypothetical protein
MTMEQSLLNQRTALRVMSERYLRVTKGLDIGHAVAITICTICLAGLLLLVVSPFVSL